MNITQKHKQKILAKLAEEKRSAPPKPLSKVVATSKRASSNQQAVVGTALDQDLSALHDIVDVKQKIALKKDHLIPKWIPIVDEYIQSGAQHPFEPLVYLAIWLLDAEQIPKALEYANHAIEQQQPMPDRFKRDLATFIAHGVHDWAQRQMKAKHSAEPYFSQVIDHIEAKRWLVNEPIVLGFMYKLAAQFAQAIDDNEKAEAFYLKCVDANPQGHGVKTALNAIQKKLNKPLTLG